MTDQEFDVLDELYFVQTYDDLKSELDFDDATLISILKSLVANAWIKCYSAMDEEVFGEQIDLTHNYGRYLYLATKKGLMAHNGR